MTDGDDLLVGIDPGKNGGIAWQFADGLAAAEKMPATELDVVEMLRDLSSDSEKRVAYIEKVGGFIAGRPAPGSAMFNFGKNYGVLIGALLLLKFKIVEITPQNWQKRLSIALEKGSTTDRKNFLKSAAQKLNPELKITLATADALLVLEAGRRAEK